MVPCQASLLIGDEVLHWTKEADPVSVDALQDVSGFSRGQLEGYIASCHIDQQGKWLAPEVVDVELHFISKVRRQSCFGSRPRR